MSWPAHQTRFVSMPTVLPLSIPAGSRATGYGATLQGVAVLENGRWYRGRWKLTGQCVGGHPFAIVSAVAVRAESIDWSTTL